VVGVILNLALFFAYHVLWPQGFGGRDAASTRCRPPLLS
jgi:chromate transporter